MDANEKDSESENELFETSRKIKAFVVHDSRKAANDMDSLMSTIERAELKLEGTVRKDPSKEFNKLSAFVRSHLDWTVNEDGAMHIERLQNSFSFDSNRAGIFIMFASMDTNWETMISSYDTRDWIEKAFDVYKTDTNGSQSRAGDPGRARAKFFIKMLAPFMRISIQNRPRDHEREILASKRKRDNVCGLSVNSVMRTLSTLMVIVSPGYVRLTPPSKMVRVIFSLFVLEEPVARWIALP